MSTENSKSPLLVSGHKMVSSGQVCVIVKDKVSKNPLINAHATKNGSFYLNKGITLEEAKAHFPMGKPADGVKWGKSIPATKDGQVLTNVFEVEVE